MCHKASKIMRHRLRCHHSHRHLTSKFNECNLHSGNMAAGIILSLLYQSHLFGTKRWMKTVNLIIYYGVECFDHQYRWRATIYALTYDRMFSPLLVWFGNPNTLMCNQCGICMVVKHKHIQAKPNYRSSVYICRFDNQVCYFCSQ